MTGAHPFIPSVPGAEFMKLLKMSLLGKNFQVPVKPLLGLATSRWNLLVCSMPSGVQTDLVRGDRPLRNLIPYIVRWLNEEMENKPSSFTNIRFLFSLKN